MRNNILLSICIPTCNRGSILESVILTDEEKYILQQHYLKGKNFACIADELGYAEITVNKKHCKILKKISKCMK